MPNCRGGTTSGPRSIGRTSRLANSRGALLASASLIVALALGAPGQALAACGTRIPTTGAHAPSSGGGGVHTGATAPHVSGSSGGSFCPTTVSAKPSPLAGVHEPGEAPRHVSLAGVHASRHSTSNTDNGHLQPHPASNVTLPKP
jgi:hypothetical protein